MEPRSRTIYAFLLTVCLAVWVGGGILTDTVTLPALFSLLPVTRAAEVGQAIFHKWNYLESLLGAVSVLLAFGMGLQGWGTRRRHIVSTSVLLGMTVIALVFLVVLTPAISHGVDDLVAAGVDLDDPDDMPPERQSLRTIHTIYAGLDVLKILAGIFILWLLASRRR